MSPEDIRAAFLAELAGVAPDIDPETVGDDDHLQDDLEMDSMDILNLVAALHKTLGVDIPESDYREIETLSKAVAYLGRRLAG
jgi:acyl carrier protein